MKTNQLDLPTLQIELQKLAGSLELVILLDSTLPTLKKIMRVNNTITVIINPDRIYAVRERERLRNYLIKEIGGMK